MNCEKYTRLELTAHQDWYRCIVDNVRAWGLPGSQINAPAVSQYPNLAAELYAPGGFWDVGCIARAARVRVRTIASAIEHGTSLYPYQLDRLAAALNVNVEYLSDPLIAVVAPFTEAGTAQVVRLGAVLEDTKGLVVPYIERIRNGYDGLRKGYIITYASYKAYIRLLLNAKRHRRLSRPRGESKILRMGE